MGGYIAYEYLRKKASQWAGLVTFRRDLVIARKEMDVDMKVREQAEGGGSLAAASRGGVAEGKTPKIFAPKMPQSQQFSHTSLYFVCDCTRSITASEFSDSKIKKVSQSMVPPANVFVDDDVKATPAEHTKPSRNFPAHHNSFPKQHLSNSIHPHQLQPATQRSR